jgi:hypothetical protein
MMDINLALEIAPPGFFADATKIGRLRKRVFELLEDHQKDGAIPTSVRFLFYELVQARILSKEKTGARRPDQDLADAIFDLRDQGVIPWDWIVDETRSFDDYSGSATVADDLLLYLDAAQIDPWRGHIPTIITESRSLAGVLRVLVRNYRARITATGGQVGGFLRTDVGPKLKAGDNVGYLGDLDLAGGDIEANTRRVLEEIVGGKLNWTRLALTREQVDEHDLPIIIKRDRRFKDGGEHEAVETEALSQTLIVDIVRDWLDELLPQPLERVLVRERHQRARLRQLLERAKS